MIDDVSTPRLLFKYFVYTLCHVYQKESDFEPFIAEVLIFHPF